MSKRARQQQQQDIFAFPEGRSENDLCAAAAAAVVEEYCINRFTFRGFPAVSVRSVVGGAQVELSLGPHVAGPLFLPAAEASAIVNQFIRFKKYDRGFFRSMQNLVVQLERLSRL
jgi:hypothetical protein